MNGSSEWRATFTIDERPFVWFQQTLSFEMLDGAFYFGLGCDPEMLHPHTGCILKVPASALGEVH